MSTKFTLSINMKNFPKNSPNLDRVPEDKRDPNCPTYHLCQEVGGNDVYLELPGCEFEVTKHCVTICIPPEVWNRIVKIGEV